jgi:hypothetical protein
MIQSSPQLMQQFTAEPTPRRPKVSKKKKIRFPRSEALIGQERPQESHVVSHINANEMQRIPPTIAQRHDPPPPAFSNLISPDMQQIYEHYLLLIAASPLDMVVNQCDEDMGPVMQWADFLRIRKLYIYSKCNQPAPQAGNTPLFFGILPNVGREGHSWVTHLIRDDVDWAEYTIFLQAGVECPLEMILRARMDLERHNQGTGNFYNFVDLYQYKARQIHCFQSIYHPCMPFPKSEVCGFHEEFKQNNSTCETATVSLRGEFILRRDLQQRVNKTKLAILQTELAKSKDPRAGHFLERDWISVLGARNLDLIAPEYRGKTVMRQQKRYEAS